MNGADRARAQFLIDELAWEAFFRSGGSVEVMTHVLECRLELEALLDAELELAPGEVIPWPR